ncbi:unnamed protein product [Prorocentrum cordatum]|uniref:Uncharacterized protein n=1 Tax=Prorocentrum cordatum TaxID=2364126 RepID=A0ABN9TFD2_9DINO|nr:unnamed protein product [Polarella glacialis]
MADFSADPISNWRTMKHIMKLAARKSRDTITTFSASELMPIESQSIAGAISYQDLTLAQRLRNDTTAGARRVDIHRRAISRADRAAFETEHSAMQRQIAEQTGDYQQPAGNDNHDSMKYLNERSEAWAARWIPSVFFGRDMGNFNDWMDWCVPYVAAVLHRPQFNARFSLDDAFGSASARRDMATEICCGDDGDTASTTTTATTLPTHSTSDIMTDSDTSDRDGLLGRAALPASVEHAWRDLRSHLANSTASLSWPAVETLSGAWATSHRMRVNPHKNTCLFGCDKDLQAKNTDDISHYISCPRMWALLAQPRGRLAGDALTRLGLHRNDIIDDRPMRAITRMAVAYRSYNIMRVRSENGMPADYNDYVYHKEVVAAARCALRSQARRVQGWRDEALVDVAHSQLPIVLTMGGLIAMAAGCYRMTPYFVVLLLAAQHCYRSAPSAARAGLSLACVAVTWFYIVRFMVTYDGPMNSFDAAYADVIWGGADGNWAITQTLLSWAVVATVWAADSSIFYTLFGVLGAMKLSAAGPGEEAQSEGSCGLRGVFPARVRVHSSAPVDDD